MTLTNIVLQGKNSILGHCKGQTDIHQLTEPVILGVETGKT